MASHAKACLEGLTRFWLWPKKWIFRGCHRGGSFKFSWIFEWNQRRIDSRTQSVLSHSFKPHYPDSAWFPNSSRPEKCPYSMYLCTYYQKIIKRILEFGQKRPANYNKHRQHRKNSFILAMDAVFVSSGVRWKRAEGIFFGPWKFCSELLSTTLGWLWWRNA